MIYFIQDTSVLNIKIGYTAGDAEARMSQLQTGSPCGLVLLATMPGEQADERALHQRFAATRIHGEWFLPVPELLRFIIDQRTKQAIRITQATASPEWPWPLNIYLAGKIGKTDWRETIVSGLRGRCFHDLAVGYAAVSALNEEWPVLQKAILNEHNYVGPYFINMDDGIHAPEFAEFTDGDHGLGLSRIEAKCSGSHRPGEDVVRQCFSCINKADFVFAWLDQFDCYGTIAEIGYARAKGKQIWIAGPRTFRDMWFIYQLSDFPPALYAQDTPRQAFEDAVGNYKRLRETRQ